LGDRRKCRRGFAILVHQNTVLRNIKTASLRLFRGSGVLARAESSRWRQRQLLILCYHGISQHDEHHWRPRLYMAREQFDRRLQMLKHGGYAVLPLADAICRLYAKDLPPKSVVLTFDDGCRDFYSQAYPRIRAAGFPVTVYQSTYYVERQWPVFNLICSYMLWKSRSRPLPSDSDLGLGGSMEIATEDGRRRVVQHLLHITEQRKFTGEQKNQLAGKLAALLGVDFQALVTSRILHLMNPAEIGELAGDGVDFQLHTHRHCVPAERSLFQKEIRENRRLLQEITGLSAVHFCYPGGEPQAHVLPWLAEEGVISATTCEPGLASVEDDRLLLPRFVDATPVAAIEFESWLSGIGGLISRAIRRGSRG